MSIVGGRGPAAATPHHSVGEAVGAVPRRALGRPTNRRQSVGLTLIATALGLWFGFAAPSVSPVSPTPPSVTAPAAGSEAAGPADPALSVDPGAPAGPGGGDGQGGRFGRTDQQGRQR